MDKKIDEEELKRQNLALAAITAILTFMLVLTFALRSGGNDDSCVNKEQLRTSAVIIDTSGKAPNFCKES